MSSRSIVFRNNIILLLLLFLGTTANAARVSDVTNTLHNLSTSGPGTVKATGEDQICVFCHTPHGANITAVAPLWNRNLSSETYEMYDSSSMDATKPLAPSDSSKLCLSCHDGTLAIGAVNVLNGAETDQNPLTEDIAMTGTNAGAMPAGSGANTGYTRNIGIHLTNDHPISITYDSNLAAADGELYDPALVPHIGEQSSGVKPDLPLRSGKLECVSCHDPHVRDDSGADIKFLRLNRFQANSDPASTTTFNADNDIICLGCHSKEGWTDSSHAHELVANETYTDAAADMRDFPRNIQVWQAACLNCHDTHTVQGARRLLREGTDSAVSPKSGGNSEIQETCYQCHSNDGATGGFPTLTSQGDNTPVPNIKSDFLLPRSMPITSVQQLAGSEVHDIGTANPDVTGQLGKDFIESPVLLGKGNLMNRHAECTDCHNPHRVTKERLASDDPTFPAAAGTHDHNVGAHDNLISGVLRGTWGVEPIYGSPAFTQIPTSFEVKRGVQPIGADMSGDPSSYTYVTREYQICLKCHSNYAFDDVSGIAGHNYAGRPALGTSGGSTPAGTNNMTVYTNQAMEYQAPAGHEGEGTAPTASGAEWSGAYSCNAASGGGGMMGGGTSPGTCDARTNNHRSWHPVMAPTGRDAATRGMVSSAIFQPPFDAAVGTQTMYCTDCHGTDTVSIGTSRPGDTEDDKPWGPHGSQNDFLLQGQWNSSTGSGQAPGLCFKCHNFNDYTCDETTGGGGGWGGMWGGASCTGVYNDSGFSNKSLAIADNNNLHIFHNNRIGQMRCNWCHVAVPHGWKNKALLVNLNDVGPEAGLPEGTSVPLSESTGYNNGPYYMNAMLPITSFAKSGQWTAANCVSQSWMWSSCNNPP